MVYNARAKPFYVALGALTGVLSLVIGTFFVLGIGGELPDVNELLSFIFGDEPE